MTIRERRRELLKGGRLMFQGGVLGQCPAWMVRIATVLRECGLYRHQVDSF